MNTAVVIALVLCLIVIDLVVVVALLLGLRQTWRRFESAYPPKSPDLDAVIRNFQSMRIGVFSLGFSVRIGVDAHSLHVFPGGMLRRLGYGAWSVPWSELERGGAQRGRTVTLAGQRVTFPEWALAIAREG